MNQNITDEYILTRRKELGQIIRAKRVETFLNQQELAELTGLSYSTISKIENGLYNFGIDYYTKLEVALGFKIELKKNK